MKTIREFGLVAWANRKLLLIYGVGLILLATGFVLLRLDYLKFFQVQVSRSDLIMSSVTASLFTNLCFVSIFLFFIMVMFRYDFMTAVLVRQKSKRSLWFQQVGKAGIFSLCFSFYTTLLLTLISMGLSGVDNNWDDYNSVFAVILRYTHESPVALWQIIVVTFCSLLGFLLTMSLLYLFFRWTFRSEIFGICTALIYLLYCTTWCPVVNYMRICFVSYENWASDSNLLWPLLAPLLWIGVLLGAGALLANRAEFYSAGKK